ncbi:hypothetical protein IP92_05955 [Pseudoduganella flava]|uniref:FeoB-associated Cys-rich membrane protein n=1 Tax=Pseudoduganella flava TaxID=871742 RepID=A0A562P6E2_9BURK|nr:DUF6587 family protein [Pseudoduganella flava]QGZ40011.1 hypothetical protein GO485_13735 [Pseudoduganella flava]TWI39941.1 hypothetical protein IP92_05955 [Pseudoduganella flava]
MTQVFWQELIVAFIVVAAALHVCRRYLPATLRQRIVFALARKGFDQNKLAKLFKTQSSCGDGCGSCGSCDTTPAPDAPKDTGPARRVITLHVQR